MANTRVRFDFNILNIRHRIGTRIERNVQPALDIQVLKDSNFFAPDDTSNLIDSGVRGTRPGSGNVIWDAIYARRQYNEDNNKSKDNNPNASFEWFEKAKKLKKKKWIKLANGEYSR